MQVPIDKNFEHKIRNLLQTFKEDKDTELEFRFGKFTRGFHAGLNRVLFYDIIQKLKDNKDFSLSESKFIVDIYSNKFRKITFDNGSSKQIKYLKKFKLENVDIDYSEYVCRLSLSKEYEIEEIPIPERIIETFRKYRYSFLHNTNDFKIDLTIIDDKYYDLELEIISREVTYESLIYYFSGILNMIMTTKYILPYLERLKVITDFNRLQHKNRYQNERFPYIKFNKPINLPRSEIQNLENNYVISPKIDGVRYFLFINEGNVYLINHKQILKLIINFDRIFDDSILDVEKLGEEYHILDMMYFKGRKYTDKNYLERLDITKEILPYFKDIKFKMIEYDVNLEEGYNKYKKYKNTDGVIYTPIKAPYYNNQTYKYKPLQTIDFFIKSIDENIFPEGELQRRYPSGQVPMGLYQLYSLGEGKMLIPFKGSKEYPFENIITLTPEEREVIEGGDKIVEFYYDGSFHPMRIREDKETPNYIDVAINIWNDINDPIKESELNFKNLEVNKMESISLDKFYLVFKIDNPLFENQLKIRDWIKRKFPNYNVGNFYPFHLDNYFNSEVKIKPKKLMLNFEISEPYEMIKNILRTLEEEKEEDGELSFHRKSPFEIFSKVTAYQTEEQKDKVISMFKSEEEEEEKESKKEYQKEIKIPTYNELEYLDYGEKQLFSSPLDTKEYRLIRFYAVPDGSCFFHAVSSAIDDEYKSLASPRKKSEYMSAVRQKLKEYVNDVYIFSTINNGDLYSFKVSNAIVPTLEKYQKILPKSDSVRLFGKDVFSTVTFNSLKGLDFNDKELALPTKINDITDSMVNNKFSVDKYKEKVVKVLTEVIKKKSANVNIEELRELINKIINNIERTVIEKFGDELGSLGCFFENQFLSILSDFFNVDIYIIRAKDGYRMPVRGLCDIIKNRTSIILLQIEDSHYELIGGYNPKTKKADIAFDHSHPFIQKLKKITCEDIEKLKGVELEIFYKFYKMKKL